MTTTAPIKVPILAQDKWSKDFNALHKSFGAMSASVAKFGMGMTKAVTVPIVGAGIVSTKMAKDFNEQMANVGTLIPGQEEKLRSLKKEVLDLSVALGIKDQNELASGGLYQTISAFGDSVETMGRLTTVAKAAKAGVASTTDSLNLLSSVTKGYDDTTTGALQKASDLAFMTVKLGQTTFPELAASMGDVVPFSYQLAKSQEELFGAMATLTGVSGNTSAAATQLKSLFGAFIKPTGELEKAMRKMGYGMKAPMDIAKEKSLPEMLTLLQEASEKSGIGMGKLLGRKEALSAFFTLTGSQAETFKTKLEAMYHVSGATEEALRQQTEGINKVGFQYDQSVAAIKKMGIEIGDKLMPVFKRLLDALMPIIDSISKMTDEEIQSKIEWFAFAAAIGPVITGIGKLGTTISGTITVFGKLKDLTRAYNVFTGQAVIASKELSGSLENVGGKADVTGQKISGLGKATKWATRAIGVLAAAEFGWQIGTKIHDEFVEPYMKSLQTLKEFNAEYDHTIANFEKKAKTKSGRKDAEKDIKKNMAMLTAQYALVAGKQKVVGDFMPSIPGLTSGIKSGMQAGYQSELLEISKKIKKDSERVKDLNLRGELESILADFEKPVESNVTVMLEGLPGLQAKVKKEQNTKSVSVEHKGGVMESAL